MFNILKKNEKTESKLKNLSAKNQELNAAELKKVIGGGGGGDGTTPDPSDAARIKTHSNQNNN